MKRRLTLEKMIDKCIEDDKWYKVSFYYKKSKLEYRLKRYIGKIEIKEIN
jgi:hypothetical protein